MLVLGLGLALRPTYGGLGLDTFEVMELWSHAMNVNYHQFSTCTVAVDQSAIN